MTAKTQVEGDADTSCSKTTFRDLEEKWATGLVLGGFPLQRGLYVVYVSHGQTLHKLSKEQEEHRRQILWQAVGLFSCQC